MKCDESSDVSSLMYMNQPLCAWFRVVCTVIYVILRSLCFFGRIADFAKEGVTRISESNYRRGGRRPLATQPRHGRVRTTHAQCCVTRTP